MTETKTGLLNATAWEQLAQRELARSRREKYDLAVLIIDLDRFKLVNDRFGHLVGDEVLKGIGRCLSAETRDYDTVGRFGGEEFVAVLPETSAADAVGVADDPRGGQQHQRPRPGLQCRPLRGRRHALGFDRRGLLRRRWRRADRPPLRGRPGSYYAKENGRNQVQRARPSEGGRPQVIAAS